MDRLLLKRGLVALSGLALVMASSGCRDRNLRVPPPAHYSDGASASPEAPIGLAPGATPIDPATIAPYGAPGYGAPGSYDPAASPTSGSYDSYAPYGAAPVDPASAGMTAPVDPASSYGYAPGGAATPDAAGVYATPSSPSVGPTSYDAGAYGSIGSPAAGMPATTGVPAVQDFGGPYGTPPATIPGLDGGAAPPIPAEIPMIP